MDTFVEGIGIVGGFGSGVEALSEALMNGKTHVQSVSYRAADEEKAMPAFLADPVRLDALVPKKALRRVDHYSKMALLGAYLALQDAGMTDIDPKSLGIVVASGYGATNTTFSFLDSFTVGNDAYSSPTYFSNSVHNAAAAHASILLGATGPCLTVSQFEMSVPSALITAIHWLREERVERVLFGALDEYCDVLGYCWRRFFGVHEGTLIEPFLFDQQTSIPGEGAAFFLLSRKRNSGKNYGSITGVDTGYGNRTMPPYSDRTFFILGADGQRRCGKHYGQSITREMRLSSYTPLYGGFPANMAFDMAVACVSMKEDKIYAPPTGISLPPLLKVAAEAQNLDRQQICCLKFGPQGESGMITLAPRSL
jgi:3-oxoacyl-[acyl-carrier-protein] synthase II